MSGGGDYGRLLGARRAPRDQARQIESLASCWRRNQTKAASFIESAKGAILTWQSLSLLPRTRDRDPGPGQRAQRDPPATSTRFFLELA